MNQSHLFDREQLRPVIGDTVEFQNTRYVVTQVGLRYLMGYLESNPKVLAMLKRREVTKWFPPETDDYPHEDKPLISRRP